MTSLIVTTLVSTISIGAEPTTIYIPIDGGVRIVHNDGKRNHTWDVKGSVDTKSVSTWVQSFNTTKLTIESRVTNRPFLLHQWRSLADRYTTKVTIAPTAGVVNTSSVGVVRQEEHTRTPAPAVIQYGITSKSVSGCITGNCQLQRK